MYYFRNHLLRPLASLSWKVRIRVFAGLLAACILAVGIGGAVALVYVSQVLQMQYGGARHRCEVAAAARVAVVALDRAHARLLLATEPEQQRLEAIAAIRAAAQLEDGLNELERAIPVDSRLRRLNEMQRELVAQRIVLIETIKARQPLTARDIVARMAPSVRQIEALVVGVADDQKAIVVASELHARRVAELAVAALVTFTLTTLALAGVTAGLFVRLLGRFVNRLRTSERNLRSHNQVLEMLTTGAELDKILQAICTMVRRETGARQCRIVLADSGPMPLLPGIAVFGRDSRTVAWIDLDPHEHSPARQRLRAAARLTALAIERAKVLEEQELAALVYRNSSQAMIVTDGLGNIIAVNPAFVAVTGYGTDEVIGRNARLLGSGRHNVAFFSTLWSALEQDGSWKGEMWNRHRDGTIYPASFSINSIRSSDPRATRYVALFSDVSTRKAAEDLIWRQANFDYLTGLANRKQLHERLQEELGRAERTGTTLALLLLDLDGFKDINDTLGHDRGDLLLRQASDRIAKCVSPSDLVARLGGDEFTVLLTGAGSEGSIAQRADAIRRCLAQPYILADESVYVSASIGITLFPRDGDTIHAVLRNADQAMYAAKAQGRDRVNFFEPHMEAAVRQRMELTQALRTAFTNDELTLHYQPIVELATGAATKAEALLRWHCPQRGWVSPAAAIAAAEQGRLISDIGNWVFLRAAQQAMHMRHAGLCHFQVSVNVSPVQFAAADELLEQWPAALQQLSLPGEAVAVEITEGLLLDASPTVRARLDRLRAAGMAVSIDDFGTGYSSLSYLSKFPLDYVKIDQSFVSELAPGNATLAVCEAVIVMAHKLGLKVIAEGIETAEQMRLLAAAGCDYGQGYWFARPMPAADLEDWLQARLSAAPAAQPGALPADGGPQSPTLLFDYR
ncbi:putative bifunctional diguanylate cyclase/phosphodiesterase [Massilia endophytica]|uniref:putative bifunctional diguanylate cyclase/phosphodiesterase n=1 Tax=Massilia endophytica TaxID=2899220 RepID=UPI001E40DE63|nr:bifunctional diguanylate cyclase/phosphodiesterase [Massilia endophytica]UGQ47989.1 EAL domain-containing protein [Massilia endophytica]